MTAARALEALRSPEAAWRLKVYGALAFAAFALRADPTRFVDSFYERRVYQQSVAVFQRRAAGLRYEDCAADLGACLGKVVVWPLEKAGRQWRYEGDASELVVFSNPKQLPDFSGDRPILMVGLVKAIHPRAVELLYVGSPSARWAGTTWVKAFGLEQSAEKAL